MTRDVTYCRTDDALLDVWSLMRERGLQRVPILNEARRPLGIIYAREALQALLSESEDEDELLRDYISGSDIGELSQATVVNFDHRPTCICADNEYLEGSGDAPSEFR